MLSVTDFESLKKYVLSFFPEDPDQIISVISTQDQQHEIESLQNTLGNERFFFIVDLLNFEAQQVNGVQKWLGYPDKEFTLEQYWNRVMHPGEKRSLLIIAHQLYGTLCKGTYPLKFVAQRFTTLVPLKHYNGHFLLTKKTSSVFRFDKRNRLMAYIDEFTIVKEYNGESLSPRLIDASAEQMKSIMNGALDMFTRMKIFSAKELQIARKFAYFPETTQAKLAAELQVKRNTIDTYCNRFLDKARAFYGRHFSSVLAAALHLKEEGLL